MPEGQKLRVVFLVGHDNENTCASIEAVCATGVIQPTAVVLDVARPGVKGRLRNLRRNLRREGPGYILTRMMAAARGFTDQLSDRAAVNDEEVEALLRKAFPERNFSLAELCRRAGFQLREVPNLNSPEAVAAIAACQADLGIVLGTRILKSSTFSVPRLGCINLHKGKVPRYRGTPPGFWALFDGEESAGVTIHFVDSGLDTGDVIAASEIPIAPRDTPYTLRRKLDWEGARLLSAVVRSLQDGTAVRTPQIKGAEKARSKPTAKDVAYLRRKLPHWVVRDDAPLLLKNLYCLAVYYSGLYGLTRMLHRHSTSRAAIVLYHRVNDHCMDAVTVDVRTFAAQITALARRYRPIGTAELVKHLQKAEPVPPTSVAIHFDDGYRDILTNAAPILKAAGFSAMAFINSGYVGTEREFPHDRRSSPFRHENLSWEELREWAAAGFGVGAHTVNHADLGACGLEEAAAEITECGPALARVLGVPVEMFAYPFGRERHIRPETAAYVRNAGYAALFSAHGGFVSDGTGLFDIPRLGCNHAAKPLFLLLELEGLAPRQVWQRVASVLHRKTPIQPTVPAPKAERPGESVVKGVRV